MKNFTRANVIIGGFILAIILVTLMSFTWNVAYTASATGMLLVILGTLIPITLTIMVCAEWGEKGNTPLARLYGFKTDRYGDVRPAEPLEINFNFKKFLTWFIVIICAIGLINFTFNVGVDCSKMYNTSKMYHNDYIQKTQEKAGFYDKMWKTYYTKDKITNINKETFLQVTKIIMENRADGQSITWKWVHENQQIPYEEFTKFYADLSAFIEAQREGYFGIEKACQDIASKHNTLLDTFPNNIYNKMLNCERIKFEYGFTSDQTEEVFRSKKENPQ